MVLKQASIPPVATESQSTPFLAGLNEGTGTLFSQVKNLYKKSCVTGAVAKALTTLGVLTFLVSTSAFLTLVIAFLFFAGHNNIIIYFVSFAIGYLIIVLTFTNLNKRSITTLNIMSGITLVGFLFYIVPKIIEILTNK